MWAALVVDGRRRQAGLDQVDPPTVSDAVVRRGRDGDGPAEVVGDSETHAVDSAPPRISCPAPCRRSRCRLGRRQARGHSSGMTPTRCQPRRSYSRSAVSLAVSSTRSVLPASMRCRLCRAHQRLGDSSSSGTAVDQHLRDLPTMRLVLRSGQHHLNGADDLTRALDLGHEHDAFAARRAVQRAHPECLGALVLEGQHEADRCATVHAVDEYVCQSPGEAFFRTRRPNDDPPACAGHPRRLFGRYIHGRCRDGSTCQTTGRRSFDDCVAYWRSARRARAEPACRAGRTISSSTSDGRRRTGSS